jgi:hypothetical protein
MKISQPDRGGNGVRAAVVNQTFPVRYPSIYGKSRPDHPCHVPLSDNLLQQIITRPGLSFGALNLFDCATPRSFCGSQGRKGFVR